MVVWYESSVRFGGTDILPRCWRRGWTYYSTEICESPSDWDLTESTQQPFGLHGIARALGVGPVVHTHKITTWSSLKRINLSNCE